MKSMEDRLKQVDTPDISISSHRAQLKARLANEPPRRNRTPYKRPLIVVALLAVVTISGISAIRPEWTAGFLSAIKIYEKITLNEDGTKTVMRAYECSMSNCVLPDSGATMVQISDDGDSIRYKVIAMGTDPASDPKLAKLLEDKKININAVESTQSATIEITENGVTKTGTMLMLKGQCNVGSGLSVEQALSSVKDEKPLDAKDDLQAVPSEFALEQNYPNPFNPETTIRYSLMKDADVSLKVYSIEGKEVATLASGYQTAGSYSVRFNGKDLPSGTYMYRLTTAASTETRQMMLVK